MSQAPAQGYVMGHNDRERRRLALQAAILNPFTEQLFRRAGIAPGMRVLDLGCGIGDISLIAGRLVGRQGRIISVDMDESALATLRQRIAAQGLGNIMPVQSDLESYRAVEPFDAVVGRHILIHMRDPLALVRNAFAALRSGGVAVFQEFDFTVVQPAYPPLPIRDRITVVFRDFFLKAVQGNMGAQLFHLFLEGGFSEADCRAEYPMDGGPDSPFYAWFAESFRTILPRAEALGLIATGEIDIETLEDRLREEAVSRRSCFAAPLMVGAFARRP